MSTRRFFGCVALYASDYEVPQNRRRVIIMGIRKDRNVQPSFPSRVSKSWIPVSSVLQERETVGEELFLSQKALDGIQKKKKTVVPKFSTPTNHHLLYQHDTGRMHLWNIQIQRYDVFQWQKLNVSNPSQIHTYCVEQKKTKLFNLEMLWRVVLLFIWVNTFKVCYKIHNRLIIIYLKIFLM
jgi:site-specific DNA-cytosine methylase